MRVIDSKPHRELGKVGLRLWRDVLDTVSLDDTASREVLLLAAEALDRAEDLPQADRQGWRGSEIREQAAARPPAAQDRAGEQIVRCEAARQVGPAIGAPPSWSWQADAVGAPPCLLSAGRCSMPPSGRSA
jgi:hypothetical protein